MERSEVNRDTLATNVPFSGRQPVYTGPANATILGLTTAMVPGEAAEAIYWLSQVKSGSEYSYTVMGFVLPPPQ